MRITFFPRLYDYYYYLTTWAEQIHGLSPSLLLSTSLTLSERLENKNLTELIFRISFWNVTHMLWASYKWFDGKYLPGKVANRLMWWKEQEREKRKDETECKKKSEEATQEIKRNWNERIRKSREERTKLSRNKWTTRNEKCIPTCFHIQYRFIIQFHK